jgi:hypothetical protein
MDPLTIERMSMRPACGENNRLTVDEAVGLALKK